MLVGNRNVYDEDTLNFLHNFVEDFKELLETYKIKSVYGCDDGRIILCMPDNIEFDINLLEGVS